MSGRVLFRSTWGGAPGAAWRSDLWGNTFVDNADGNQAIDVYDLTEGVSGPSRVQVIGQATAQSAGASLSVNFSGPTKPQPGDWIIVRFARDNVNNDPATADSITATPGGETYTRVARAQPSGTSSAGAGVVGGILYAQVQTAWAAGTNAITWTGANVTARAMHVEHWTGISGVVASSAASGGSATSAASATTGASIPSGGVVIGMAAIENGGGTFTEDSDSTNGSWTNSTGAIATGTSGNATTKLTFQTVAGASKVVTAAGTQTYNPTYGTSTDMVAVVVGFTSAASGGTVTRTGRIVAPAVGSFSSRIGIVSEGGIPRDFELVGRFYTLANVQYTNYLQWRCSLPRDGTDTQLRNPGWYFELNAGGGNYNLGYYTANGARTNVLSSVPYTVNPPAWVNVRVRCQGADVAFRTWLDTQPEPFVWAYRGSPSNALTWPGDRVGMSVLGFSDVLAGRGMAWSNLEIREIEQHSRRAGFRR